ncbi:TIGR04222 domain-containing membrane protein [Streptomyces sp. NBC_01433]|uniref:TIGR04222 domain-containing membrane protein n=1 Tax=Streptomyces sp. NBC_01433 TaxID=2903864 RepID=UPI00224F2FF3|nr:TIGR04222 domain-containing membrane protein [Streptomyces sp. NBC_01433]MCX4674165.1 TIGR04222 domain-containing membrane protein [Streptomyces sp. NBC_01433]
MGIAAWTAIVSADGVGVVALCALMLTFSGRRLSRSGRAPVRDPDPYKVAYLAGGPRRVVEAALHEVWGEGDGVTRQNGRLRLPPPPEGRDAPVERAVIAEWGAPGGTAPARLRARAVRSGPVRETGDRLVGDGLVLRPGRARARRLVGRVLVGVACATVVLAACALVQGLPHPGPLLALAACGWAVRWACPTQGTLTPAGRRHLARTRRTAPWAASDLGAVVFGERTGLPGEPPAGRSHHGAHPGLPSVGRTLIKLGKALDREDDRHPGPGADDRAGDHGGLPDGPAHHSCGSGSGCGSSY